MSGGARAKRGAKDILRRAEDIRIHGGSYPILSVYCVDFRLQYGNFTSCRLPARVQCSLCRQDIVRFCGAKSPEKRKNGAATVVSRRRKIDLGETDCRPKRDHLLSLM